MIVTIDGPAGAGKSTVARRVAHELDLPYLNSGFIYRAVTFLLLEEGADFDDVEAVTAAIDGLDMRFEDVRLDDSTWDTRVWMGDREISRELRQPEVTSEVHRIASVPAYRERLVELQRRFAQPDGVVAEGRDMGSVIFPEADVKIYLDASAEERAARRHRELVAADRDEPYLDVLRAIVERDAKDFGRSHAPLLIPEGAHVIRCDNLGADGVVEKVLAILRTGRPEETSRGA